MMTPRDFRQTARFVEKAIEQALVAMGAKNSRDPKLSALNARAFEAMEGAGSPEYYFRLGAASEMLRGALIEMEKISARAKAEVDEEDSSLRMAEEARIAAERKIHFQKMAQELDAGDALKLSTRTENRLCAYVLATQGIELHGHITAARLESIAMELGPSGLMDLHNFGLKSLTEVRETLAAYNPHWTGADWVKAERLNPLAPAAPEAP